MKVKALAAIATMMFALPALAALEPCRLLTTDEITSALGGAPTARKALDPATDTSLGAKLWTCEQQVGKTFLSINVIEFGSAAAATQVMTKMIQEARDIPGSIKLTPAPGLGDRAASGASAEGAIWVVLKGNNILTVTLAGEMADPPRLLDPLKRLATLALARL
jgi:hypothetical protein